MRTFIAPTSWRTLVTIAVDSLTTAAPECIVNAGCRFFDHSAIIVVLLDLYIVNVSRRVW